MHGIQGQLNDAVRKQPAAIPSMKLLIDAERGRNDTTLGDREPARLHGTLRMNETKKLVHQMVELVSIKPSRHPIQSSGTSSQTGITKWRFCVDFKILNMMITTIDFRLLHAMVEVFSK